MGCQNYTQKNNDIIIKSSSLEGFNDSNSELDMIDKNIEKRHSLFKLKPKLTLEKESNGDKYKIEFIRDTNNELNLCKYLDELKN